MVYLIHFDKPLHHANHYIGYAKTKASFNRRIERHRNNTGARILVAVNNAGILWDVVMIWPKGDRTFERKLKNQKNSKRYCPNCKHKKYAKKEKK